MNTNKLPPPPPPGFLSQQTKPPMSNLKKAKLSVGKLFFRTVLLSIFLATILGGIGGYLWLKDMGILEITDNSLSLITNQRKSDNSIVYDRNGKKIGEFFSQYHVYVPYQELPQNLINAIVAIEDKNFWSHHGIDPHAMARALWIHLKGRGEKYQQGASTITQQVVRHFLLSNEKTIERKLQEIILAVKLEKKMSKKKILELYVNTMFLGNGSYGVGAAAYRYFGKPATQLNLPESALIAGLFQLPSKYNPVRNQILAKRRQHQVIKALYEAKLLKLDDAKIALKEPLNYQKYNPLNYQIAPYFIDHIKEEAEKLVENSVKNQGLRIYTTLDTNLQKIAEYSIKESIQDIESVERRASPVQDADGKSHPPFIETALLVLDPRNGEVLAMVGGRDYDISKFNRTTSALRSPGSAFKPIVYSLGLNSGFKWSDVVFVSPITIDTYRPKTPTEDYLTETTLLRAFYRSMNGPTVELGQKLGLGPVLEQAQKLGIRSPIKNEFGSILGSSGATMTDLGRVYSTFANSGILVDTISITKITDRKGNIVYQAPSVEKRSQKVISPEIAYLMTQGMKAVFRHGTAFRASQMADFAAGKTGTSNDSKDNWFCGYTPDLVAIVWAGLDSFDPLPEYVAGASLALPTWERFIRYSLKLRPPKQFIRPPAIVSALVNPKYGNRDSGGVQMFFIEGYEPVNTTSAFEQVSKPGHFRSIFTH